MSEPLTRDRGLPGETLVTALKRATLPRPIFILAAPGIPAQTVAAMLGQHPECWDLPEINLEMSGNLDGLMRDMIGMRSAQMHGLLRVLSQLLTGEQTLIGIDAGRRWLSRHSYLPTSAIWHLLAQRIAPRRIVAPITATLFESGSLGRLVQTFPDAQFIALTMHPKSHGQAVMAQHGGAAAWLLGAVDETVQPIMPEPSEVWQLADHGTEELAALVPKDQLHTVRIEDLAHHPVATLARLLPLISLSARERTIAALQHPQASPFHGRGPFGAHSGGDILSMAQLADEIAPLGAVSLDGRAPWRPDGMPLDKAIRSRAVSHGYL